MKPHKILTFIAIVLGSLLCLAFFFPKEGIKITDDWVLHFPTIDEILEDPEKNVVDISDIIAQNQVPEDSLYGYNKKLTKVILKDSTVVYYQPLEVNPEDVTRKIEFPSDDRSVLHPFFRELSQLRSNGKLIRILHYGDSQIEADRISSYLRYKLQGQFGGSGPGLIPAIPAYGLSSPVKIENSEGWKRYPGFGKRDSTVQHSRYGVLASISRFAPYELPVNNPKLSEIEQDTLEEEQVKYDAWLTINHSPYSSGNVKRYKQCRMFYGYNKYPVNFKLYSGTKEIDKKTLPPSENLQVEKWHFNKTPPFLHLEFNGYDSPDIYALALDGMHGIAVDNIPLRGSSGLIFTRTSQNMLKAIYRNLNTKLIILQFGGNVAPTLKDNYDFYKRSFYNQMIALKKMIPGVSIVVVGIADMSLKEKDQYVSYPNVLIIRDALKEATFNANCAYWDTYEAMGGENSMPSWVFADPPLAEKDFVHFTVKGSRIVAQMFYKALMLEYNSYFNSVIKNKKSTGDNNQLTTN